MLLDVPTGNRATAANRLLAPFPGLPPGGGIFYQASQYRSDIFLVDHRRQPQIDADLLSALVTLRIQIAAATAASEMYMMTDSGGPPLPGDGGYGTNTDNGGSYDYVDYGAEALWMEVGLTNSGSASLLNIVIHPPASDTNLIYDVLLTTNLTTATPAGALNATNWIWLGQTLPGQTNIQVDTSQWPSMGFIRLANAALDPDGDGLSTGVELSCAHSNPNVFSTDGTGMSDLWEYMHFGHVGVSPTSDPDGDGLTNYQEYMGGTDPNVYDNYGVFLTEPKPGCNLL